MTSLIHNFLKSRLFKNHCLILKIPSHFGMSVAHIQKRLNFLDTLPEGSILEFLQLMGPDIKYTCDRGLDPFLKNDILNILKTKMSSSHELAGDIYLLITLPILDSSKYRSIFADFSLCMDAIEIPRTQFLSSSFDSIVKNSNALPIDHTLQYSQLVEFSDDYDESVALVVSSSYYQIQSIRGEWKTHEFSNCKQLCYVLFENSTRLTEFKDNFVQLNKSSSKFIGQLQEPLSYSKESVLSITTNWAIPETKASKSRDGLADNLSVLNEHGTSPWRYGKSEARVLVDFLADLSSVAVTAVIGPPGQGNTSALLKVMLNQAMKSDFIAVYADNDSMVHSAYNKIFGHKQAFTTFSPPKFSLKLGGLAHVIRAKLVNGIHFSSTYNPIDVLSSVVQQLILTDQPDALTPSAELRYRTEQAVQHKSGLTEDFFDDVYQSLLTAGVPESSIRGLGYFLKQGRFRDILDFSLDLNPDLSPDCAIRVGYSEIRDERLSYTQEKYITSVSKLLKLTELSHVIANQLFSRRKLLVIESANSFRYLKDIGQDVIYQVIRNIRAYNAGTALELSSSEPAPLYTHFIDKVLFTGAYSHQQYEATLFCNINNGALYLTSQQYRELATLHKDKHTGFEAILKENYKFKKINSIESIQEHILISNSVSVNFVLNKYLVNNSMPRALELAAFEFEFNSVL